jgi:hypothetical protein
VDRHRPGTFARPLQSIYPAASGTPPASASTRTYPAPPLSLVSITTEVQVEAKKQPLAQEE